MRINLIGIGKTDDKALSEWVDYYASRLPKHWNFEFIEIPDIRAAQKMPIHHIKKEEAKLLLDQIEKTDYCVLLDETGKSYTSRAFAEKINKWMLLSQKRLVFVIGGANGFSEEILQRGDEKVSLSKMTFTHQMIRLFFVEQLYRANQIIQGKPYHKD